MQNWFISAYNWLWQPAHWNNFQALWIWLIVTGLYLQHQLTKHGSK